MTESPKLRTREHIIDLDGLRGIAILAVLAVHSSWSPLPAIAKHGSLGVDLFFALSGFLITRIRLVEKENDIGLFPFLIKRSFRIFPAAYLCLLGVVLYFGPSYDALWSGLYVTNIANLVNAHEVESPTSHFWTLACEEQFYMVWPVVLVLPISILKRVAIPIVISGIALMLLLPTLAQVSGFSDDFVKILADRQVFTRGWVLLAGSAIAIWEPELRHVKSQYSSRMLQTLTVIVTVSLVTYAAGIILPHHQIPRLFCSELKFVAKQSLLVALVISALAIHDRQIFTPLRWKWLTWTGTISYGVYLYHLPIFFVIERGKNSFLHTAAGIALTFFAASVSYYFYEKPLMNWGRRLASQWRSDQRVHPVPSGSNKTVASHTRNAAKDASSL